jgi:hypothetical protein
LAYFGARTDVLHLPNRRAKGSTCHVDVGICIVSWQVKAVAEARIDVVAEEINEQVGDKKECCEEGTASHTAEVMVEKHFKRLTASDFPLEVPEHGESRNAQIVCIIAQLHASLKKDNPQRV